MAELDADQGDKFAEDIAKLKRQPGKDIVILGNAALGRPLLEDDLLDTLRLMVHPIVVGTGKRLFEDGGDQKALNDFVDGRNVLPLARGAVPEGRWPRTAILSMIRPGGEGANPKWELLRMPNTKYVRHAGGDEEYYDFDLDPFEARSAHGDLDPEVARHFHTQFIGNSSAPAPIRAAVKKQWRREWQWLVCQQK